MGAEEVDDMARIPSRADRVDTHVHVLRALRDYWAEEAAERGVDMYQVLEEYIWHDIKDHGQVELTEEGGHVYRYRPMGWGCGSADDGAVSSTVGAVDDARPAGCRGLDGGPVRSEGRLAAEHHRDGDDAEVARREDAIQREYGGHTRSLRKGRD